MEINETTILDDRGFIKINGDEAKTFLQNIVTNDIEKITDNLTLFSSIFTPQGKYLYEFFILKFEDGYLLECAEELVVELKVFLEIFKLSSDVEIKDISGEYVVGIISNERFEENKKEENKTTQTIIYRSSPFFQDPRSKKLGSRVLSNL